jgi:hypothetical protein
MTPNQRVSDTPNQQLSSRLPFVGGMCGVPQGSLTGLAYCPLFLRPEIALLTSSSPAFNKQPGIVYIQGFT